MAINYLEPVAPLKKIDEATGDINYIYPITTVNQVIMEDGERLNTILTEKLLYLEDEEASIDVEENIINADLLNSKQEHELSVDNANKLNNKEENQLFIDFINKMYPVGSTYITNTNASPASYLGGTWELFDKEFAYFGTNSLNNYVTLNTTNCTAVSGSIVRTGHQLFFKVTINPAVDITDTTTEMFTFNLADIGVSSLTVEICPSFFSDGGQVCVSTKITTSGVLSTLDAFVRNTTTPNSSAAGTSVGQALINYNIYWKHMLDSACDKFYWKRTA